ncbi:MAG: hypothetical protein ACO3G4_10610 [Opitutaceae bacterium]
MPSLIFLATQDPALAEAWSRHVPAGRVVLRLGEQVFPAAPTPGFAAVVVLDAASADRLPAGLARCPTILVGEPRSLPFEQARLSGRAKVYLSYAESAERLGDFLPVVDELAEQQALAEALAARVRRDGPGPVRSAAAAPADWWEFVEGALEHLERRDALLAEFRRGARRALRSSRITVFVREGTVFRAAGAEGAEDGWGADDPLVGFFEARPAVVDGSEPEIDADPLAGLAVRNRLALWGARLIVPVHDNGRLLALLAVGVRDDGAPHDAGDRERAVQWARWLRLALARSRVHERLAAAADKAALAEKYLPGSVVLGPAEAVPRQLPVLVRELIGQARRNRAVFRESPRPGQPGRAAAGIVAETGGVWAWWDDAATEVRDAELAERLRRREVLRGLALTLSHELGNALVSLTTFRQAKTERMPPPALMETIKADVGHLEALNANLAVMQGLHEAEAEAVDIRELAQEIGKALGLRVEAGAEPLVLLANRKLLDFALRAILRTVGENRGELGLKDLSLRVRATGSGSELTALLAIKGRQLELEGILPEPEEGAVPTQGRLGVFLAKEILRLHHGEIHAGPGLEGTEILLSLRKL